MAPPTDDDLKSSEERKREANWNAALRWRVLQETLTWADSQATVRRNTRQKCLELERAKRSQEAG